MTGAVKNMYGCIQGLHKAKGHTKYSNAESFARMLVDLNRFIQPRLYIMDGITAMEGNGPASGTPVHMGCHARIDRPGRIGQRLLWADESGAGVGTDQHAGRKDGTWRLAGRGYRSHYTGWRLTTAQVREHFGKMDYDVNRGKEVRRLWRQIRWLSRHFQRKPYIVESRCIRCGICVEACPVEGKAIHLNKPEAPVYDYKKCIACFCCQEMCPKKAIQVK